MHAGKLGQVTNFTIIGGAAKHCVDQFMVLFRYCLLGGGTAMPGGLRARLCHAFLVLFFFQPFLIRGLATPWTYFLHLSLSSAILIDIDSSMVSPVHVLMLSIQAVHGLPRLRAPGIVPCIISFSRQLPYFLMVWPYSFSALTVLIVLCLLQLCWGPTHLFSFSLSMKLVGLVPSWILSSQRRLYFLLFMDWFSCGISISLTGYILPSLLH